MDDLGGHLDRDRPNHSLQDAWQILELAAIHYPDKLAVVDCGNDTLLTYAELHQRAAQIAAWLQRSGVRRGDRVGILARNSSYVMELHFAAAALHAVVVNLNIHLAPAELTYILSDSKPKVTFADREYAACLVAARAELAKIKQTAADIGSLDLGMLIWMDIQHQEGSSSHSSSPPAGGAASSPASSQTDKEHDYSSCFAGTFTRSDLARLCSEALEYGSIDDGYHMYYTSGTTGHPKGVVLSHRIVVHHAVGTIQEMQLNRHDVWAHLAPMFHLVDVFAVYAITLVGGRHVTYPSFNAVEALLLIERERVTVTNVASTMISMLVNNPLVEQLDLTCLRVISCGGSPQSPAVVTRAIAVFGCEFFLSYGMTECCGKISMSILPEDIAGMSVEDQLDLVYTSGRPFSLIDVRVVDEDGKDVAKDGQAVGEVWVRGPTVFDGYFGSPEATKEAFSPDHWFKTGDLATASANGYIKVVDRKKDMLLVGGENVYTTEVESVLHAHPAVHQAAVLGVPNRVMGELVAAAVTLVQQPGGVGGVAASAGLSKELIAWCKERLAEYKVPTVVHIIDKFPTTGSGKIMKTELRNMFASAAVPAAAAAATFPTTAPTTTRIKLSPKQIAVKLSQHCVGDNVPPLLCHVVDAELGKDMGKDLLPDASYLILLTPNDAIDPAERLRSICCVNPSSKSSRIKHAAVVVLERPQPRALAALAAVQEELGLHLVLLHIAEVEFQMERSVTIRTALAAAKAEMPPLAATLYFDGSLEQQQSTIAAVAPVAAPVTAPTTVSPKRQPVGPSSEQISKQVLSALSGLISTDAASRIASGDPLMASGVTSTLAVQLVSALESSFSIQLPGTLVFDYPSLPEMTKFLVSELQTEVETTVTAPISSVRAAALPVVSRHAPFSFSSSPSSLQITKLTSSSPENIVSTITQQVVELLGRADVDPATPLMAAGVTSTLAVQLVSALEAALGTELPGTLVFDYPTVTEMADFVAELVVADDSTTAAATTVVQPMGSTGFDGAAALLAPPAAAPIERPFCVITASACAAPGGSLATQATKGNDRITLVPLERWDVGPPPADVATELNLQFGSFLPDVAMFDPGMFGISPAEALLMDPQQRLVMHTFSEAMGGHLLGRSAVRETGVFVGVSQLDYARTAYETGSALNTYYATGSHLSVTSGRLSYTHGFKGPALTVDTACSSSLVTTHLASRALYQGECRVAGSIGVNLTLVHSWTRACLRAGMLAEDGHCKTMDASAGKIYYIFSGLYFYLYLPDITIGIFPLLFLLTLTTLLHFCFLSL